MIQDRSDSPAGSAAHAEMAPVRVWDLPVRLFHWALVALVATSIATGLTGGNAMLWHMRSGAAILALVAFRVLWGLAGSSTARFADFLHGPRKVTAFVKALLARRPAYHAGHNPLGGWMVLILIAALLFQAATGLFSNDDIATEGPLYRLVSKDTSDWLTGLHKANARLLWVLIGGHVVAVAFHWLARGENLVRPMFTGIKRLPAECGRGLRFSSPWLALGLFLAVALGVFFLVK